MNGSTSVRSGEGPRPWKDPRSWFALLWILLVLVAFLSVRGTQLWRVAPHLYRMVLR